MIIKFIKDLSKDERSDFKKSNIYNIINENWSTTDSYIKYNTEYFKGSYFDYSLVVFEKNTFYIAMISFSKEDTLSFFGEAINIYDLNNHSVNLNLAYNILFKKILILKKEFNFAKLYFSNNGKILSKFFDNSFSNFIDYQMYIDLSKPENLIKMNLRKSYKSLINWGLTNLKMEVISSENANRKKFDDFKNFHIKVSGRKTRNDHTWDLQFEGLTKNQGYLVLGYLEGKLVSGVYIIHGSEIAYYGVGVNDRELMLKNLPIGHAILYESILFAKKKGLNKFMLGSLNYVEDEKVNAILKFKKGFTNTITSNPKYLINL